MTEKQKIGVKDRIDKSKGISSFTNELAKMTMAGRKDTMGVVSKEFQKSVNRVSNECQKSY